MYRMNTKRFFAALIAVAAWNTAASANAALVTYEFRAVIRDLTTVFGNTNADLAFVAGYGIEAGAVVTGTYTLDTSQPDANPDPQLGRYFDSPVALSYRIGDLDVMIPAPVSGSGFVDVLDNVPDGDRFVISSLITPVQPGFISSFFDFILYDETGSVFDSDGLPAVLPPLSAFSPYDPGGPGTYFSSVLDLTNGGLVTAYSEITMLRVVPLPAAFWFMGSGILALAGLARRRRA